MQSAIALVVIDQVDRSNTVLVDGQSLIALHGLEMYRDRLAGADLMRNAGACNLVQNLVLYEQILVDSQLLAFNEECRQICELFPTVFKGLRIESELRKRIVDVLSRAGMGDTVPLAAGLPRTPGPPQAEEIPSPNLLQGDGEGTDHYERASSFEDSGQFPFDVADANRYELGGVPPKLRQTGMSILRTHFYLELSRNLCLCWSPHPTRAEYFKLLNERIWRGVPEESVKYADRQVIGAEENPISEVDLTIPPVAELVVSVSAHKGVDFVTAINEVRSSEHACRFRKWCAEMSVEWRPGRAGTEARQKIKRELDECCLAWKKDINLKVRYEDRVFKFSLIPAVGRVLTIIGLKDFVPYKDPVLWADKPYLLFLNDLYRPFRIRAQVA